MPGLVSLNQRLCLPISMVLMSEEHRVQSDNDCNLITEVRGNESTSVLSMAANCRGVDGPGEREQRSVIVEAFT